MVKRVNPYRGKSLDWMRTELAKGETVKFLAEDLGSPEWENLATRINALASEDVLSLYELWRSAIGQHTWAAGGALMHPEDESNTMTGWSRSMSHQ